MTRGRKPGFKHPSQVRAKMSAASKAAWADPKVRAKMSAARKAALADPKVRAKMSAASKAAWADREEAALRPIQIRAQASAAPAIPSLGELLGAPKP